MGYSTVVEGSFTVDPPINWSEISRSLFNTRRIVKVCTPGTFENKFKSSTEEIVVYRAEGFDLDLIISEVSRETPEGELIQRTAHEVRMRHIDEYRARDLVEQVQGIIEMFPGHTFQGRLECAGNDSTDVWRVEIHDGEAVRVDPRILWPEDFEDFVRELTGSP